MTLKQFSISLQSYALKPVEFILRYFFRGAKSVKPIWIIGAPRSGTTLMYQLCCSALNATYLSNRVATKYRIALTARMIERILGGPKIDDTSFDSNYGYTQSPNGPHEGGAFFYQYFPKENPYSDTLKGNKKSRFKKLVEGIASPSDLFISKNTIHSLRIKALANIFPHSVFIWVTRDKVSVAHSIIKAREAQKIPVNEWWGVKPPGWRNFNNEPEIKKALWQVTQIESIIEHDLSEISASFLKVSYKDICSAPREVVTGIAKQFGLDDYLRNLEEVIPEAFRYSALPDDKLADEIKNSL